MDSVSVYLVSAEDLKTPILVDLPRSISLKALLDIAERTLGVEVYTLYVNNKRLLEPNHLETGDTVLATIELTPQAPKSGFFCDSEHYDSFATNLQNPADVRIVVLGPQGAGKTSLILRFVLGFFKTSDSKTLVEAEYDKSLHISGQDVTLSLTDTAGELTYDKMSPSWLSDNIAYIIALGIDQLDEWSIITHYTKRIRSSVRNPSIFVLITKIDLIERMDRASTIDLKLKIAQIESYCKDKRLILFKTSAKTNKKVQEMFLTIARRLIEPESLPKEVLVTENHNKQPFFFKAVNRMLEAYIDCLKSTK